jgi:ketosteroid isomerase-like protein
MEIKIPMKAEKVALAFVDAINAQQIEKMYALMTENHVFVDSDGGEYASREVMRTGWLDYFAMVPDFRIEVRETFARNNVVVMVGTAFGTFSRNVSLDAENHWSVPAAWRVVVEDDRVATWQLYVNPEPMQRILERIEKT